MARVLHLIDSEGLYGAEQVIVALSREMKASSRFEPVIGCLSEDVDSKVELANVAASFGLEVARFQLRKKLWFVDLVRLCRQIRDLRIDIIHSHGYKPAVFGYLASKIIGIQITATCHLWYLDARTPLSMKILVKIERFLYRSFTRVVAVSEGICTVLVKSGVSESRIRLIPNGIVLGDYVEKDAIDSASFGKENEVRTRPTRLVNVGRLTSQKGQWAIVDAVGELRKRGFNIRCEIVGDGELRGELSKQISDNGLVEHVALVGFRTDIKRILQSADIFLLPSLSEGLPIALLEAVASGVPVVVSLVGDVGKIISHKVSGLVVKPSDPIAIADAVSFAIENPELASSLAAEALRKVRDAYSSKAMLHCYCEIYDDTIAA